MTPPTRSNKPLRAILWLAVSDPKQAAKDKESLPDQEARLRALADGEGWDVIDVIRVPGFSRDYYTFREFADDAAQNKPDPISDPLRMFDHWRRQDFDVFACYDGSRFGRDQSIFAEVVNRTIDMDARLYTLRDGWIDATNRRMFVSMAGYAASGELDKLRERRDMGMRGRAKRGLPTSSQTHHAYKVVRDDLGHAVRLEVVNQAFYDDVWTLLVVDRITWSEMERVLHERFGHTRADGKRFAPGHIYQQLHSPTFWGHSARHYVLHPQSHRSNQAWMFDVSQDPPEGVEIYRDTHPAVWQGEKGARAIAEMLRRKTLQPGSQPYATHRFAGLLLCDECGYSLTVRIHHYKGSVRQAMYCKSRYGHHYRTECSQTISIKYEAIQTAIDSELHKAYAAGGVDRYFGTLTAGTIDTTDNLRREIAEQTKQLTELLSVPLQSSAARTVRDEQAARIDARLAALQHELDRADRNKPREAALDLAQLAEYIKEGETFWEHPDGLINARLHAILGQWRFVVRDGVITGAIPRPARNRQKRRRFS